MNKHSGPMFAAPTEPMNDLEVVTHVVRDLRGDLNTTLLLTVLNLIILSVLLGRSLASG